MSDPGRATRAYVSAYDRARVHKAILYRFEKRRLVANFRSLLQGRQIRCTTWHIDAPEIGVISDPQIDEDRYESSVMFRAQLGGWATLRCDIMLDTGEEYNQVFRVNVREASWFKDDLALTSGPYSVSTCVVEVDSELFVWPNAVLHLRQQTDAETPIDPDGYLAQDDEVVLDEPVYAIVYTTPSDAAMSVRISGEDPSGNAQSEDIIVSDTEIYTVGTKLFSKFTSIELLSSEIGSDGFYCVGIHRYTQGNSGFVNAVVRGALAIRSFFNTGAVPLGGLLTDGTTPVALPGPSRVSFMRYANSQAKDFTINGTETVSVPSGSSGQEVVGNDEHTSITSITAAAGQTGNVFFDIGIEYRAEE